MSAIFELFQDDSGCYRFHLKSASGEVLAHSDTYPTRHGAELAMDSVRHCAATAFVDDQTSPRPAMAGSAIDSPVEV